MPTIKVKGQVMYEYAGDSADISLWSKIKIFVGKIVYKSIFISKKIADRPEEDILVAYNFLYDYIENLNNTEKGIFN